MIWHRREKLGQFYTKEIIVSRFGDSFDRKFSFCLIFWHITKTTWRGIFLEQFLSDLKKNFPASFDYSVRISPNYDPCESSFIARRKGKEASWTILLLSVRTSLRNCVPCALRSTSGNELTYRAKTRIDSVLCIAAVCPSVAIACTYTCVTCARVMQNRGCGRTLPTLPTLYGRSHEGEHATKFRGAISFRRRGHLSERPRG